MSRLVALALTALAALPAAAQGTFATAQSGDWTAATTWTLTAGADADGLPDGDDAVTVRAGHAVSATSGTFAAASLTVAAGGTIDGGPYWSQTLTISGPVVNRGTLGRDLALRLGGAVTNGGVWQSPTTLTAAAHTLAQEGAAPFDGALTVETAGAVLRAGSALRFAGDNYQARVSLGTARLEMGPHRLTLDGRWLEGTPGGGARVVLAGDSLALVSPPSRVGGQLIDVTVDGPVTAEASCDGTTDPYGRATCLVTNVTAASLHAAGFVDVVGRVTLGALTTDARGGLGSQDRDAVFTVTGPIRNRGALGHGLAQYLTVRAGGDLHNAGRWTPGETRLLPGRHVLTQEGDVAFEQRFALEAGAAPVAGSDVAFSEPLSLGGNTFDLGPHALRFVWREGSGGGWPGSLTGPGVLQSAGGTVRGDSPYSTPYFENVRVEGAVTLAGRLEIWDGVVMSGPVEVAEDGVVATHYGISYTLAVEGDFLNRGTVGSENGYTLTLALGGALGARARADGSPALFRNMGQIRAAGLDVDGATFDDAWIRSTDGTLTQFQNATFTPNVPNTVSQLIIEHPGLPGGQPFTVRQVTFRDLYDYDGYGEGTHDPGKYLVAVDTEGESPLRVEITNGVFYGNYVWTDYHLVDNEWRPVQGWFVFGPVTFAVVDQALLDAEVYRVQQVNNRYNPDHPAYVGLEVRAVIGGTLQMITRSGPDVENRGLRLRGPLGRLDGSVYNVPSSVVLIPDPRESPLQATGSPRMNAGDVPPAPGTESLIALRDATGKIDLATANVVSAGGANVVSAGGANVISAGGGNVVSAGGANVVSAGGANVVSAGGGNLTASGAGTAALRTLPLPDGVSLVSTGGPPVPEGGLELFVVHVPVVRLDARVLLAGALDAAAPSPALRTDLGRGGLLPQTQPYGDGALAASPARLALATWLPKAAFAELPDVVDWVVVELQTGTADSLGGYRRAALLLRDGRVVDYDGTSPVAFAGVPAGDYVVRVHHRTHLAATSAAPVALRREAVSVDFTAPGIAAAGSQREVAAGVFAQVSGDVDADGAVTPADLAAFAALHGEAGYSQGDLLLDGAATARDAHAALVPALAPRSDGAPAPGVLDARLRHTADPMAGTATAALELRGAGTLGTSTFRVRYDPTAVRLLDGRALAFVGEQPASSGTATYAYEPPGALVPLDSAVVTVRVTLLGGPGAALPADYAEVARIRFETLDAAADPAFAWDLVEAYDAWGGLDGAFGAGAREVADGGYAVPSEGGPAPGPAVLALGAAYPNPARGAAAVPYALPTAGPIRLTLHDMLGREVAVVVTGERPAGSHAAVLEAGALTPGVYVVRLAAGGETRTARLTVVR